MTATMERLNEELTLDELTNVCGGLTETQDNAIAETLMIAAMTFAAKLIIQTIMPDTFDEFHKVIKNHPALVQTGIAAVASVPGIISYNLLSESTKKKFWRKVYDALK